MEQVKIELSETARKRLTMLRNILYDVKSHGGFSLGLWGDNIGHCGFTGCAVGHACRHPKFNDLGLFLLINTSGNLCPSYKGYEGWEAVRRFFHINENTSHYLFHRHRYPLSQYNSPKAVIARINKIIRVGKYPVIGTSI